MHQACGCKQLTSVHDLKVLVVLLAAVLRPGFRLVTEGDQTKAPTAAPCQENTYNSGNNRILTCFKCPGGLVVPEGMGTSLQACSKW